MGKTRRLQDSCFTTNQQKVQILDNGQKSQFGGCSKLGSFAARERGLGARCLNFAQLISRCRFKLLVEDLEHIFKFWFVGSLFYLQFSINFHDLKQLLRFQRLRIEGRKVIWYPGNKNPNSII